MEESGLWNLYMEWPEKVSKKSRYDIIGEDEVDTEALLARAVKIKALPAAAEILDFALLKSGKFVIAVVTLRHHPDASAVVVAGAAKCSRFDAWKPEAGASLAFMRALKFCRPMTNAYFKALAEEPPF